jgi:Na+-transporting methylmalonyl-CoA/oxaloacetate decarboxylase gamma subunit
MTPQAALQRVIEHREIFHDEMISLMRQIMGGEVSPVMIAAIITGLRVKKETIGEIAAAASVMRELATPVKVPYDQHFVDIVGTGGDAAHTFNISSTSAFVVAAAGGKVAKHGGRSVSSSSGAADKYVTPSTNNKTIDSNAKMEKFEEHDSIGIGMAISAMSVVFSGLLLLYISFKIIGKISVNLSKRNAMRAKGITDKKEAKEKQLGEAPGEVFAAISLALHEMQSDVHDVEDTVLTITRVKRSYSPWSSKIYTLRETPQRK